MKLRSSGKAENVQTVHISKKLDSEKRRLSVTLHVRFLRAVFSSCNLTVVMVPVCFEAPVVLSETSILFLL
jgi:hypothetical protein